MQQTKLAPDFDPIVAESFDDPHDLYKKMRGKCPVAHSDGWTGFWALFKYDDVVSALQDSQTFVTSVQNVVPKLAFTGRRPPLHLDPPAHTPYRHALNPLFRPERMAALEPKLRGFAAELLAPMLAKGGGDLCAEFSYKLPIYAFAEFMNMGHDDAKALREVGTAYNIAVQDFDDEAVRRTSLQLYDIARDLIALRKAAPLDPAVDPTSALLAARDKGEPLPDDMILGTLRQFIVVGMVAPSVTIGSFAVHLSRHPDLQDRLRREPQLIPEAVEELLRLYTPYRGFARTAKQDVEFRGRKIKKDEPIALVYMSANRDEDVFPDADQFKFGRPSKEHLAFGMGPHQCAGKAMARLELRVALEQLLASTRRIEVVEEGLRMTRWPEYGTLACPVKLS